MRNLLSSKKKRVKKRLEHDLGKIRAGIRRSRPEPGLNNSSWGEGRLAFDKG